MGLESLLIRILAWMNTAEEQYAIGLEALEGTKTGWQDAPKAARYFKYAADRGHVQACFRLGECCEYGIGRESDPAEAARLYQLALDKGYVEAFWRLGDCYRTGNGVAQDSMKALSLYREAAEQDALGGINGLGICYEQGIGVKENHTEAVRYFRKAAEQGYAEAQYNLGRCYIQGIGVLTDPSKAMEFYKEAAAQAPKGIDMPQRKQTRPLIAEAHFAIAECYAYGLGVEMDDECAELWYRDAANLSHPEGRIKYAAMLRNQE